jgi:tRNA threonylcarbamoyladenosine biosynthesis protein TsaB
MQLSIDTSTRYASVAVSHGIDVVVERTWCAERNHSVELIPQIRMIMKEAGAVPPDLDAVYVASGPGGFSALRIGMATAKSIAMSLRVPLVAVGTLEIEMAPHLPSDLPVCAILDGGGDRLYAGWLETVTETFGVLTVEELIELTSERTVFCGEAAAAVEPSLSEHLGELADVRAIEPPTRGGGTLAALGFARLQAGQIDDPDTLEPLYMRSAQYEVAYETHLHRL